ncbi:pyruvate dehydrogenase E2 (dihydrolipoamide acetyltransferase) [Acidilobus saccharovorans 345-15]|uniref:Pyruvate dehydrogenase E2 (Dihydrolipoamide acetyltransferase) n=1 Tax=Acidilobus saccharovorans (strain DSM 16705 / JCM 18335 / VKM B-2471 / 345-15) TaxID=666510 RepID=D9Q1S0_ACIS3|nr:2-oxo acid dehydrogenase subunit E2 [Acidilobus saccharovorans]ADL19258.1 pyruvate dehydrogenase E2 (dihydrolipoamide acetyltransferase) [Acidilobus saccharovorans 345-15]
MPTQRRLAGAEEFFAASMTLREAGPRLSLMRLMSFDGMIKAREELSRKAPLQRLTPTVILLKVMGALLSRPQYNELNSRVDQDTVITYESVNVALPIYRERGRTTVIVVEDVNRKTVEELSSEVRSAKEGTDYSKATFLLVNLGVMGIDAITGISLPGIASSVAIGRIRKGPVYDEARDRTVTANIAWVTLTVDPRVVGPDVTGSFLADLASVLANKDLVLQLLS